MLVVVSVDPGSQPMSYERSSKPLGNIQYEHDPTGSRVWRRDVRPTAKNSSYTLITPNGTYEAGTLHALLWLVLSHRFSHLLRGEGWKD